MPRPAGYIPQHCHHRPTKTGYVRLSGKSYCTGRWATPESEAKYDRLVQEWIANGRQSLEPQLDSDAYVVSDLLADFWTHAKVHYRHPDGTPTGELGNIRYAFKPMRAMFGEAPRCRA